MAAALQGCVTAQECGGGGEVEGRGGEMGGVVLQGGAGGPPKRCLSREPTVCPPPSCNVCAPTASRSPRSSWWGTWRWGRPASSIGNPDGRDAGGGCSGRTLPPPRADAHPARSPSNSFCKDTFDKNYKATIGVDFEMERFEVLGVPFSLQL